MAFNSVNQTPSTIILSSSDKYDFLLKLGIGVAAVGVGGYIIYKVAQNLGSGPAGGSCSTPGTPCYEALQPYQQQWSYCFTEYQNYMNEFIQEDLKNNVTFPTPEQQSILSSYQNCMTSNEEAMTKTAKQFISANVIANIAYIITGVGTALLVARVSPSIVKAWKNLSLNNWTGSSTASRLTGANIWGMADDGQIPATNVDLVKSSYISEQNTFRTQITYDLDAYYADQLITDDELNSLIETASTELTDDTDTIIARLELIR
jgi:hypothetical protein